MQNQILTSKDMTAAFERRGRKQNVKCLILGGIAFLLMLCMMMFGNTFYTPDVIWRVFLGEKVAGASFAIMTLRLPRMLAALLSGAAFGMAGNTFQTMLKNPLASPDIIGVSSGSSVAAVYCILILHMSGTRVSILSVISGLFVALLIYFLSKGSSFAGGRLILIGIGVQAMLSAVISYLLLKANEYDVPSAMRWLSGSINGVQMKKIPVLTVVVLVCGFLLFFMSKDLKILELGEMSAITLGLKTNTSRILMILAAVCLIAFATAVTGPIAFVAFLSGPIAKKIIGYGTSSVLASAFVGMILVSASDLIGQYAFATKYPVGVITGILGAPYFVFLLIQMNKKGA